MTGLLGTQQIAGTPNLQVPHGDLKAGTEFCKIPDGRQPFFRNFRQVFIRTVGEIGIGVAGRASYTAAELMQLGKTKPVCIFNNEGVGIGDIQSGFNDGGANQYLDGAVVHSLHHIAQGLLAHLTVGNTHADAGNPAFDSRGTLVNGFGAVVQIVDLTAPLHFPADGIINDRIVVLHDEGLHRIPVRGRLFDGGHIPDAGKGHIQRSGYGGSGEGQHVHPLGHFLQTLLVADTEALLLIDDQQPQILELDRFLQQLVGADDEIHGACPQIRQGLLLQLRGPEPVQHVNIYRETPEAGNGGGIVLLGKNGGGNQNGHLLSVHDSLHNSPEGNFRLSEAHIAAEQTIHGGRGFHIPLDVGNAPQLVVGFRIGEIVFKFLLPGCVRSESKTRLPFSGGIQLDQLSCHILGSLSGLGFGFLPGIGADFVQLHRLVFTAAADIFADHIQLGGGNKEGITALIGDLDVILDGIVHLDLFHSHETADAVVFVNHQISGGQVGEGIQLLPVGGTGLLGSFSFGFCSCNQLTFRKNCQTGQGVLHTVRQGTF